MPVLPPGVSERDFSAAISAFQNVVGRDWVFTSDADVALYRDAYSPIWGQPDERVASAAVAPDSVEQVQQIVRTSNTYKIPLFPISTGKNLGYGGSAPNLTGSVVVDLKRMNRVLEVDDKRHYALVEPGVAYFDLYRYIQERKLNVWVDVPDPGWGSVVGNALDHGAGYTTSQFRNHWAAHCGLEVVLPNGDVMRTGMGAMPGAKNWQDYPFGFGPTVDGLFAQGNYGIVTKMGIWLLPAPEAYTSGTVTVPKHDDLIRLVETVNYLENVGVTNGMPGFGFTAGVGNAPQGGPGLAPTGGLPAPNPDGSVDIAAVERAAAANNRPFWSTRLQFYGPKTVVAAQWEYAKTKLLEIPGARATDGPSYDLPLRADQLADVLQVGFGVPNLAMFSIGARSDRNPTPSNGHLWFSPIVPRTGEAILEAQKALWRIGQEVGLPFNRWSMPTTYWSRAFIFLVAVSITRNAETDRRNVAAFRRMVKLAGDEGYGEYRTHPLFQDNVMDVYSFNNHALRRFCEALKEGVDPNGIMAPGRSGIWPKRHPRPRA
jgi:4-cresol dehydrogenase (hydroxylating)